MTAGTSAAICNHRMNPGTDDGGVVVPPPVLVPSVRVQATVETAIEGDIIRFTITRRINLTTSFTIGWFLTSGYGPSDFQSPTFGTVSFLNDGVNTKNIDVDTAYIENEQGDRDITIELINPNGCTIDSAYIRAVTVLEDYVSPPPTTDKPKIPADSPIGKQIYIGVAGPAGSILATDLADAHAKLTDGGTIYLDSANYGTFDFKRKFTNGVVIRSRVPYLGRVTGRWFFDEGENYWLYQTEIAVPSSQLNGFNKGAVSFNSKFIATRNIMNSSVGFYAVSSTNPNDQGAAAGSYKPSRDWYLGWNDFIGENSSQLNSASHIKLVLYNGNNNTPTAGTQPFERFYIYDNYFRDPTTVDSSKVEEVFNLYIGDTKTFHPDAYLLDGEITGNLSDTGNKRRFLYLKRAVRLVAGNHCKECHNAAFTQRHGWGGTWERNRNDDAGAECVIGGGRKPSPYPAVGRTVWRYNYTAGATYVRCGAGAADMTPVSQAANYAYMYGNTHLGNTILGRKMGSGHIIYAAEGGLLKRLELYQHSGNVVLDFVDPDEPCIVDKTKIIDSSPPAAATLTKAATGIRG